MAQLISQGNIFGRLGTSLGQALAEQVPKEIDRNRLASGLKDFEKDSGNLSPLQAIARYAAIPGALENPQLTQTVGDLAKYQNKANSIKNYAQDQKKQTQDIYKDFLPNNQNQTLPQTGASPSLTDAELFEKKNQGYVPRDQQQIIGDAAKNYPGLFQTNPNEAIALENDAESRNEKIALENEKRFNRLQAAEDDIKTRLKQHSVDLSGNQSIPANVYSDIEDKAIQSLKPFSQKGKGLTAQQAVKEYGKELDNISRQYSDAKSIGKYSLLGRAPKENERAIKSLQKEFDERGDSRNLADTLISDSGLSPMAAYARAEPVSRVKSLNKELSSIKPLQLSPSYTFDANKVDEETLNVSKKLAPLLEKKGSPLAVAYELRKKNYNPQVWLDYLEKHKNDSDIDLTGLQIEQLRKPQSITGTLADWWLSSWSGIE